MSARTLSAAVELLAARMITMSDLDLGQPWAWGPHDEGVRFAALGSFQELQQLAVALRAERAAGNPISEAQMILGQKNAGYRDTLAVLLAADDVYDVEPAPGEWSLRYVLRHMVAAERRFFSLVHYGVRRQRSRKLLSEKFPEDEPARLLESEQAFDQLADNCSLVEMLGYYRGLHERALAEFADISDVELVGPSLWWEGKPFSIRHRLHRMAAHALQHTVQAEKTLVAIGRPPNEAQRLLRAVYGALAEVEAALIGAPELVDERFAALAETIAGRADEVEEVLRQANDLIAAVNAGDLERIAALAAENPQIVNARNQENLSALMAAAYAKRPEVVAALEAAGAEVSFFEAAALGKEREVQRVVTRWPETKDHYAEDGFTLLQLSCYFGQEQVALWLIKQGADVNARAKNATRLCAIHAAAANGSLPVLGALLAQGADVNAAQAGGFTPLHQAAHRGDAAMAKLFLAYGASLWQRNELGQTAGEIARANGYAGLARALDAGPEEEAPAEA